ncbi:MAG TPA: hypothetical protein VK071_06255 [Tissierellales bacterium]|nr:hypothetical protein [Tissierellales bacterium]
MWTAVYVVEGLGKAKKIEKTLTEEGFLVEIKFFSKDGYKELYEILTPEFEAEDVYSMLIELGYI